MAGQEGWGMVKGRSDRSRAIDARKRAFDIVIGVAAALIALPVIVLSAVGSAIALQAWPFFSQERIGRDGERFRLLKVRTLPVHVPRYVDKHQLVITEIPAFCRLLRRLHLDELPQLFLVITGHMSLVGPRPEMPYLHDTLPEDFGTLRTSVRPGCTGLWQISDSCTDLIGVSPEYDRFYLAHLSFRLDLWVLARTALKMFGRHRPLVLEDMPGWAAASSSLEMVAAEHSLAAASTASP